MNGILSDVVGEFQRIRIAAAIHDMSIAASHQPAEVPAAGRVLHWYAGANSNQRVRTRDEEFLFGIVISRTTLDEDLVLQRGRRMGRKIRAEVVDPQFDRTSRGKRIHQLCEGS